MQELKSKEVDLLLEDTRMLFQEIALGADDAKKQMLFQRLMSSVSFISPIVTMTLIAAGTLPFSGLSLTIMGLFALMNSKRAWDSGRTKLYELFFEPHHKYVMELDDFLKDIVNADTTLKKEYKSISIAMFKELKQSNKSLTKDNARAKYIAIYRKYMTSFTKRVERSNVLVDDFSKKKFKALLAQLRKVRIIGK